MQHTEGEMTAQASPAMAMDPAIQNVASHTIILPLDSLGRISQ